MNSKEKQAAWNLIETKLNVDATDPEGLRIALDVAFEAGLLTPYESRLVEAAIDEYQA